MAKRRYEGKDVFTPYLIKLFLNICFKKVQTSLFGLPGSEKITHYYLNLQIVFVLTQLSHRVVDSPKNESFSESHCK